MRRLSSGPSAIGQLEKAAEPWLGRRAHLFRGARTAEDVVSGLLRLGGGYHYQALLASQPPQ
jgi:hypothetical protein